MSYVGSGQMPIECASKIGHMKFIQDPHIQRMLSEFESTVPTTGEPIGFKSGHVDIESNGNINLIICVDGGQAVVPNEIRSEKRLAFLSICALLMRVSDIEEMKQNPIVDPRVFPSKLQEWHNSSILPLSGIRFPDETIKDTIRKTVDSTMYYTGLYPTLNYLVSREWDPKYQMGSGDAPHFHCRKCGEVIYIPKSTLRFRCSSCSYPHTLSDYLGIGETSPEDWAREETATALRDVLETLTLFHYIRVWHDQPHKLEQILFIKDGPLLLRAGLYRLADSIRALIQHLHDKEIQLHLVGVEKNGELVNHVEEIKAHLPEPGDFFAPSMQYVIENIRGYTFDPSMYRNRVQYGTKVVARIGPHHVIPVDVPTGLDVLTGNFLVEPKLEDLYGFEESLSVLAKMTCYSYENALIPIVLANTYASISQRPSGDILYSFASRFFS